MSIRMRRLKDEGHGACAIYQVSQILKIVARRNFHSDLLLQVIAIGISKPVLIINQSRLISAFSGVLS